jgi:hypothetical protein
MIKLTKPQVHYISSNMLKFLTRDNFVLDSSVDVIRELKEKNIICRSKRRRIDVNDFYGYKFTDYFISVLNLNAVNIYGSNELMYLIFDPVYEKAYNIKRQVDISGNELDRKKLSTENYEKICAEFHRIKNDSLCILRLIAPLLRKFEVEIPEKLKEPKRRKRNETRQVNSRIGSRNRTTKRC